MRFLVREGSSYSDLAAAGAQAMAGDLKDGESLRVACEGVDAVVTTANSTARSEPDSIESVDLFGDLSLIQVAEAAGYIASCSSPRSERIPSTPYRSSVPKVGPSSGCAKAGWFGPCFSPTPSWTSWFQSPSASLRFRAIL